MDQHREKVCVVLVYRVANAKLGRGPEPAIGLVAILAQDQQRRDHKSIARPQPVTGHSFEVLRSVMRVPIHGCQVVLQQGDMGQREVREDGAVKHILALGPPGTGLVDLACTGEISTRPVKVSHTDSGFHQQRRRSKGFTCSNDIVEEFLGYGQLKLLTSGTGEPELGTGDTERVLPLVLSLIHI